MKFPLSKQEHPLGAGINNDNNAHGIRLAFAGVRCMCLTLCVIRNESILIKREIQYSSTLTDREIRKEVNLWLAIEKDKARRFVISWPTTFRNPKFNGKWISAQEFSIKRNAIATINYQNPFKPNINGKIQERKDNLTPVTIVYRLSNIGLMILLFFLVFISLIYMQHEDTKWIEFVVGSTFVYGIIYLFYLLELNIARGFIIDRLKLTKRK